MKPFRIQLFGVFPILLLCWGSFVTPLRSAGQSCAGTVQKVTYSTTLSGPGSNTYITTALPQYYSASGYTLISAVVTSVASSNSTVSFQNTTSGPLDFGPTISHTDLVRLNGAYLTNSSATYNGFPYTFLDPAGFPTDNVTYGPQTVFNNTPIIYDSITTSNGLLTSAFSGMGNLNFSYKASTFVNNVQVGVNYTATASDNITFAVTYYFCNPVVLSANVLTFTATLQNDRRVALNWITTNEKRYRRYDIEVSGDDKNFVIYTSQSSDPVNSDASYLYNYPIKPGATGKLYFRLKQVEVDGTVSYSPVRIIDLGASYSAGRFSVYPNPPNAEFVNLTFCSAGTWQVDVISADGNLIQRNYYQNTAATRLNFQRKLAAGAYFVKATDQVSLKNYVSSFVINH